MSYRVRSFAPAPAPKSASDQPQVPSALRIMTALVIAFVLISLLILLAGRVPFSPQPLPQSGSTSAQYVSDANQLLTTYGRNADGTYHIPINEAMKLIVERGLPVRATATPTP
ncbi:MAG: hypothetical protein HGA65_07040 [Oscillochloris sp.]|nr:hypothetical protein [Oscillochloris sp.]